MISILLALGPQDYAVRVIPVSEAIQRIKDQIRALTSESVRLEDALGRFLAEDVVADSDLPPFDRSQMDGYALRSDETESTPTRLQIVGESAAGRGWHHELQSGQAVRIMTGAPVPSGADSVQQVELTHEVEGNSVVEILEPVAHGRSIVKRGSEIKAGETVLKAGERITANTIAVLASFGFAEVKAGRKPRVTVLATGSELVPVGKEPGRDQIRDSNNYTIGAYAELAGASVERLPLTGDDLNQLKNQIGEAAERSDIVVTSGGVSMGVYDLTKAAIKELGAEIFFERIALRPGKPTVFARLPNRTYIFGLPGNPVSVSVTFNLFVRTALLEMQGALSSTLPQDWAILTRKVKGATERESYLPCYLKTSEAAELLAEPLKWGGSSDFVAFARATALINVPAGSSIIEEGLVVNVLRLPHDF